MPMQYSPTKLESVCVGTQKELIWLVNVIARLANDSRWIMSSSIKDTFCTFIIIKLFKSTSLCFLTKSYSLLVPTLCSPCRSVLHFWWYSLQTKNKQTLNCLIEHSEEEELKG